MITIKSQEYVRDLYRFVVKQEHQGVFVIKLFNAAGCSAFVMPKLKSQRTTQLLENERHYAKDRSVLVMRDKFPNSIDIKAVSQFWVEELDDAKLRACMDHFAIPVTCNVDKKILAESLAIQFQYFLDADEEDIKPTVSKEYLRLADGIENGYVGRNSAIYVGDDLWVEQTKTHQVLCYEQFTHTWVIHNYGKVHWQDRKLVLKNENKNNPRPERKEIPIPDVGPNGIIKISTNFKARSMEGIFVSEWEMQDSSGKSCFEMSSSLNVTMKVSYRVDVED